MLFVCLFKDKWGGSNREKAAKLEKFNSSCVSGYTDIFKMLAFCFLMVDGKYVVAGHSAGMRVLTEEVRVAKMFWLTLLVGVAVHSYFYSHRHGFFCC